MIQAIVRGRLPEVENYEDLLTSSAFGLISYLPFLPFVYEVLLNTKDYSRLRNSIITNAERKIGEGNLLRYTEFEILLWPSSSAYGEPDVIIILKAPDTTLKDLLLIVEIKYTSGKSGTDENDQLKRYFHSIVLGKATYNTEKISCFDGEFLGIVYLTDMEQKSEVLKSLQQIGQMSTLFKTEEMLYELRWPDITEVAIRQRITAQGNSQTILSDLVELLEHHNFVRFAGLSKPPLLKWTAPNPLVYRFEPRFYNGVPLPPRITDLNKQPIIYRRK